MNRSGLLIPLLLLVVGPVRSQEVVETDSDSAVDQEPPAPTLDELGVYQLGETGAPLSLSDAHRMAVKHNPSFLNVNEQVTTAETYINTGWSMLLPNLSATARLIGNKNEVTVMFPEFDAQGNAVGQSEFTLQDKWQKSIGLTANMTLLNARSFPLIKNAYDSADQARLNAQVAKNELLFAVTAAYYQVINFRKLIDVYAENLAVAGEFLKMAKARKTVGDATRIDVMRAKMEVTRRQQQLDDAIDAYHSAKQSLSLLIGETKPFTVTDPGIDEFNVDNLKQLRDTALAQRRELQAAKLDVIMAERSRRETKAKWLPKLDVTMQTDISSVDGFTGDRINWMLIFGANWSILEGGGRFAELKRRAAAIRIAQNRVAEIKMQIETAVNQQRQEVLTRKRAIGVSKELVSLAEESHSMVTRNYQVGMATSLDVLNAASTLASQRLKMVLDTLRYQMALLTLRKTIGEVNSLALTQ